MSDVQTTNFDTLTATGDSALKNINNAWQFYRQLETKANATPYNQKVKKQLATFNYSSFEDKHGLVKEIFKEVKPYLAQGDIRGIYSRLSSDMERIYYILEDIQYDLNQGIIPTNEKVWRLHQECAKTILFGQYVARVFMTIK